MKKSMFSGKLFDITERDVNKLKANCFSFDADNAAIKIYVNVDLLRKDFGIQKADDIMDQQIIDPRIAEFTVRELVLQYQNKEGIKSQDELMSVWSQSPFDKDGVGSGAFGSCARVLSQKDALKETLKDTRDRQGYSQNRQPSSYYIANKVPHFIAKSCSSRDWYIQYAEFCMMHHARPDMDSDTCLLPKVYCIVELQRDVNSTDKNKDFRYMVLQEPLLKYGVTRDRKGRPLSANTDSDTAPNLLHYELWQSLYTSPENDEYELSSFTQIKYKQTTQFRKRLMKHKQFKHRTPEQLKALEAKPMVQQYLNFAASLAAFCNTKIHRDLHGGNVMVRYHNGKYQLVYTDPVAASECGTFDHFNNIARGFMKQHLETCPEESRDYLKRSIMDGLINPKDALMGLLMGNAPITEQRIATSILRGSRYVFSGDKVPDNPLSYQEIRMEKLMYCLRKQIDVVGQTILSEDNIRQMVETGAQEISTRFQNSFAFGPAFNVNVKQLARIVLLKIVQEREEPSTKEHNHFYSITHGDFLDCEIDYEEDDIESCPKRNFARALVNPINDPDVGVLNKLDDAADRFHGEKNRLGWADTDMYGGACVGDQYQMERATWGKMTDVVQYNRGTFFGESLSKMLGTWRDTTTRTGVEGVLLSDILREGNFTSEDIEVAIALFKEHQDMFDIHFSPYNPGEGDNLVWCETLATQREIAYIPFCRKVWGTMGKLIEYVENDAENPIVKCFTDFAKKHNLDDIHRGEYNTDSEFFKSMVLLHPEMDKNDHNRLNILSNHNAGKPIHKDEQPTLKKVMKYAENLENGKVEDAYFNFGLRFMFARGIRTGAYFGD